MGYKLTFAIHVDNVERIAPLVNAIREQMAKTSWKHQLVLVDAICEAASREILHELQAEDALVLQNETALPGESYRQALSVADGDYVMCLSAENMFEEKALSDAVNELQGILAANPTASKPLATMRPVYYSPQDKKTSGMGHREVFKAEEPVLCDLELEPDAFSLYVPAYFFPMERLADVEISEHLPEDAMTKVLFEELVKSRSFWLLTQKLVTYEAFPWCWFEFRGQFSESWYIDSLRYFLVDALKEDSPLCAQYMVLFLLQLRYGCNLNERDKSVLIPDKKTEFFKLSHQVMKHVSDEVIATWNICGMKISEQSLEMLYFYLKYQDEKLYPELVYDEETHNLFGNIHGANVGDINQKNLLIQVIYFDGKNLTIDARYTGSYLFAPGELAFVAKVNGVNYPVRENRTYSLTKVFNETIRRDYTFQCALPSDVFSKDYNKLEFFLVHDGIEYPVSSIFARPQSKLNKSFSATYYAFDKKLLQYDVEAEHFVVRRATRGRVFLNECKLMWQFIKKKKKHKYGILCAGMRVAYWLTKPFYEKKRVWLTQDKLFKAGDNGEYFFRYVMNEKQGENDVKLYYVVDKESPDYTRLKKEYGRSVLCFNTLRHRLIALHADMILATHVDVLHCNGFTKQSQLYFKDLFNGRVACLAHGLTIQKIAQYQNRTFDNTVLYFFASKYEVENVKHEIYDYYDESMLKLTGHGRYDGLINNDQKQLLITPTWRRGITSGSTKKGSTYAHSDTFKSSDYYRIYNGLINDERLIAAAKEYGYRIMYLLHPAMSNQLEDFDQNEYVDIVAATSAISYEKVLTESSLMVTDYSGVQFDFAYMKKPVVYYHPSILPPQYESSGLNYETMGFGPICTNHEEIVESLCDYMKRSCEMEEEYRRRVDDFYAFSDHNNCARMYEEIIDFQNRFPKANDIF